MGAETAHGTLPCGLDTYAHRRPGQGWEECTSPIAAVAALHSTPYTSQAHVPGGNNVELVVPPAVSEEEFAAAVADIREEIDQLRGGVTATTGSVGKALEDIGGLTDADASATALHDHGVAMQMLQKLLPALRPERKDSASVSTKLSSSIPHACLTGVPSGCRV